MTRTDRIVRAFMSCLALICALFLPASASAQQSLTLVLTIEGCDTSLGTFSQVTGLDASFDLAEYRSDEHANVTRWFFPIDTPPRAVLTLRRAGEGPDEAVLRCLIELEAAGEPTTATITMLDSAGEVIVVWEVESAFPVKWTGASEDGGNSVGMETLVLSHEGFVVRECTRCTR